MGVFEKLNEVSVKPFVVQLLPNESSPGQLTVETFSTPAELLQAIHEQALKAPWVETKKGELCFSPVILREPYLKNENVTHVTAFVTDHDGVAEDFAETYSAQLKARGISHVAYPSPSYGEVDPQGHKTPWRWRFVHALSKPVEIGSSEHWSKHVYPALIARVGLRLAADSADPSCSDPRRLYYAPCRVNDVPRPAPILFIGEPINVDAVLTTVPLLPAPVENSAQVRTEFGPASPGLIAEAAKAVMRVPPAIQGQGGQKRALQAGGVLLRDFALTEEEAAPLLLGWNAMGDPPFDPDIDTGDDSLWARVRNKNFHGEYGGRRKIVEAWLWAEQRFGFKGKWHQALNDDSDGAQVPASVEAATYAEAYERALQEVRDYMGERVETAPPYRPVENLEQVLARGAEKRSPPVIEGLVLRDTLNMILAIPKSGKTWDMIDIGLALASGKEALGKFRVPTPVPVFLFLAEDLEEFALERVQALMKDRGFTEADKARFMFAARQQLNILSDESLAGFIARLRLAPVAPKVVLLDPLVEITTGLNVNDWREMSLAAKRLKAIRDLLGCTVIFTHHGRKPSKDKEGQRGGLNGAGSISLYAAVESTLYIENFEREGTLTTQTIQAEGRYAPLDGFCVQINVEMNAEGRPDRATVVHREVTPYKDGKRHSRETDRIAAVFREAWKRDPTASFSNNDVMDSLRATGHGLNKKRCGDLIKELAKDGRIQRTESGFGHRYAPNQLEQDQQDGIQRPQGVAAKFLK